MFNIESYLGNTEWRLSAAAALPGVGAVAAAVKIVMGVAQVIFGLAVGIFATPFSCRFNKAKELRNRSFGQVVHGLGNIVAGGIEAVPFIGTIAFYYRYHLLKKTYLKNITLCQALKRNEKALEATKIISYIETKTYGKNLQVEDFSENCTVYFSFFTNLKNVLKRFNVKVYRY